MSDSSPPNNPKARDDTTPDDITSLNARIQVAEGLDTPAEEATTMAAMEKGQSMAFRVIVEFTVPIIAGAWLGNWLDGKFETSPVLVIVIALLGFGVGLKNIIRLSKEDAEKQQQDIDNKEDNQSS